MNKNNNNTDEHIIFTIGHSNREHPDFIRILKHYKIEVLVDVRSYPRSKRNTQFDGERLEAELQKNAIEYVWMKELGGMRPGGFEAYMKTEEFQEGLTELRLIASENRTVFMCAELRWRNCHRSLISGALFRKGCDVVHIYNEFESELHSELIGQ